MNETLCDVGEDRICRTCGRSLPRIAPIGTKRRCLIQPPVEKCNHLLDPTGGNVLQFGCGCSSEKKNGINTAVYECELHGRCAPLARGTHLSDETVVRCVACKDNPANSR